MKMPARVVAINFHEDGIGPSDLKGMILLEGHLSTTVFLAHDVASTLIGGRYPWYFDDVIYAADKTKDDRSRLRVNIRKKPNAAS